MKGKELKVAHFSFGDTYGAFGAAYELHKGLQCKGINSDFFVRNKTRNDDSVIELEYSDSAKERLLRIIDRVYFENNKKDQGMAPIRFDCVGLCWNKQLEDMLQTYDVFHIHWVAGFLSINNIFQLSRLNKPIVWTLHDFHPFTGGCHYPELCVGYEHNCSNCPELKDNGTEITKHILLEKQFKYSSNIHLIAASLWLKEIVQHSKIFKDNSCEVIPIGIDTDFFILKNKENAKQKLGLTENNKVILIGAQSLVQNVKGYAYLKQILQFLKENAFCMKLIKKQQLCLLTFGHNDDLEIDDDRIQVINMGFVNSREKLCDIYNAADVFIFPSIQETFGMTAVEAMSCGVPTVAFNVCAMRDVIVEGINGYKAEVGDCVSMAEHIIHILRDNPINADQCRKRIVENYSLQCETDRIYELYHKIKETYLISGNKNDVVGENKGLEIFIHKCAYEILTDTALEKFGSEKLQEFLLEYSPQFVSPEQKVKKLVKKEKINNDMQIYIYGAGVMGKRTMLELEKLKINIKGFWDLDEQKIGMYIKEYQVKRPIWKEKMDRQTIIIAGTDYISMIRYLIRMGYSYGKDFF